MRVCFNCLYGSTTGLQVLHYTIFHTSINVVFGNKMLNKAECRKYGFEVIIISIKCPVLCYFSP